jgi:prepilin signal peptidase PulO-like enzyme (type II secretory pathway)
MRLTIYKILSFVLVLDIIALVWFLTVQNWLLVMIAVLVFILSLALQVILVKCPNCGTRPGLWLLAVWTLFLDFELYFSDTVLLKECTKCDFELARGINK